MSFLEEIPSIFFEFYSKIEVARGLQDNDRTVEPPDVEVSAQLVKCKFLSMPVYADKVTNLNNDTGMSCLSCTPTARSQT